MRPVRSISWLAGSGAFLATLSMVCPDARAVPSFTRQTGLTCVVCHRNPPELTAFGRKFKLEAYTLADKKAAATIESEGLKINGYSPLSVTLLLSATAVRTPVPGADRWEAQFPEALSLFLAGEIAPHLGGLLQTTYSHASDHISLDHTDLRYARHTTLGAKDLLFGFTLNNSPTVEDVWNNTTAWGFPWLSPGNAPSPAASPLIAGALAADVAGLGAYTLWNDHLYAGITLYRSEHAGGPQPLDGKGFAVNIHGAALYWRVAWQQIWGLNYLEVGTYGIYLGSVPGGVEGVRDVYTDAALDLQYERPFGVNLLTLHATYIHESSRLDATFAAGGAASPSNHLNLIRADATLHIHGEYSLSLGGFSISGSADPALFAPAPVTGSMLGSPDSKGFTAQAGFWPEQNVEFLVAYTGYAQFNGGSQDYDGSGRPASANDSLYAALWLSY